MKLRNLVTTAAIGLLISTSSYATVTLTGTALKSVTGLTANGQIGVYVIDNNNTGFGSFNLLSGNSITSSASYGANFTVVGSVTSSTFGGINIGSPAAFALGNGVDAGDHFAIVLFTTSTTNAIAGDTYRIWTDPTWVLPSDSSTVQFTVALKQLTSTDSPASTKTVATSAVPEPSTYAAIAGLIVLGLTASKRRRIA